MKILQFLALFMLIASQFSAALADQTKQSMKTYGYPRVIYTSYVFTRDDAENELAFIVNNKRRPTYLIEQTKIYHRILFPIEDNNNNFPKYKHRFTSLDVACKSKSRGIFFIKTDEYHFDEPSCLTGGF